MSPLRTFVTSAAGSLVFLMGWTHDAALTPDSFHCRNQVLLGANEDSFFYLSIELRAPPSYYDSEELVIICKKRNADFQLLEQHDVSMRSHHRYPTTMVDTTTSAEVPFFDVQKYLAGSGANFARSRASNAFAIENDALILIGQAGKAVLLSAEQLRRQIPDLGVNPRVVSTYDIYMPKEWPEPYEYFLVEFSELQDGCTTQQSIVGVPQRQVERLWGQLSR